jgi:ATP-dependent exoDNAse (exonuclease V) beta subunit
MNTGEGFAPSIRREVELDEVYATERQLLYVAATRARDRLVISGVTPASEFLGDLQDRANGHG